MTTIQDQQNLFTTSAPLSPGGAQETLWLSDERLHAVPLLEIVPTDYDRLVVLGAAPTDETFGAAGLLNAFSSAGVDIEVLVASVGENTHPFSPTYTRAELAEIRQQEASRALGRIAPRAQVQFLKVPGGDLDFHIDAVQASIERLSSFGGRVLIVCPSTGYAGSDHAAIHRCARSAARAWGCEFLEYPVNLWDNAAPTDPKVPWSQMRRLTLTAQQCRLKAFAMECHRSQIADLSDAPGDEAVISSATLSHFSRPFEIFLDSTGCFTG